MNNRKLIEFVLTYPNEIKKAIDDYINDPNRENSVGHGSGISDPTFIEAAKRVDDIACVTVYYGEGKKRNLRHPRRWLKVQEATKKWYAGTIQETIIERRFKDKPDERKDICDDLKISTSYYAPMLKDIYVFASGYAAGLGIINIF